MFIGLLAGLVNGSNHTKYFLLSSQKRFNLLLLIYILMNAVKNVNTILLQAKLDRCVGSCNILNNLSNKACIPNKTENLNLIVFKHDLKTITKHIS